MARKPNPIPTAPTGPSAKPRPAAVPTSVPGSSGSGTKKTGSSSGSKSGGGGASGYEKRAIARENEAKRKAAERYTEQAKTLEAQARALKHALAIDFEKGLHQQLGDISETLGQQQELVREGFRLRRDQLRGSARDNEKAQAGQSEINTRNQLRERNSALSEAAAVGAGESDTLATMMMSLRNWQANQTEVQRGYFDTLRSINQSLTDLNIDTKTALANNAAQANADREQLWTNYHNQKSEAFTQLGNIRGQQADYYVQAAEMGRKGAMGKDGGGKKDGGKKDGGKKDGGRPSGKGGPPTPAERNDRIRPGGLEDRRTERRAADPAPARRGPFGLGLTTWAGGRGNQTSRDGGRSGLPGWVGDAADRARSGLRENRQEQRQKEAARDRRFINASADNAAEARKESQTAFLNAAKQSGKSWDNPGIPDAIMDRDGAPMIKGTHRMDELGTAMTARLDKVPEGATLRKWV